MSRVIAGTGNYASDWASAINQDLIKRVSSSGDPTIYTPSADTDVARGTALKAAFAAIVDDDTLYISGGVFDLGTDQLSLSSKSNISIIGSGLPLISTQVNDTYDSCINTDSACDNINISGLAIHGSTASANATSNLYAVTLGGGGVVEGCDIYLESNSTSFSASVLHKTLVHVNTTKDLVFKNCNIGTINAVSGQSDNVYIGAFHDGGSDTCSLIGCSFLNQYTNDSAFVTAPQGLFECSSNTLTFGHFRLIGRKEASNIFNARLLSLYDETLYMQYWKGITQDCIEFQYNILAGSAEDLELFRIEIGGATVRSYEIKITDNNGCFYNAFVRTGSDIKVVTGTSLTNGLVDYSADYSTGSNHTYSVVRNASNRFAFVRLELKALESSTSAGAIHDYPPIVLADLFEV